MNVVSYVLDKQDLADPVVVRRAVQCWQANSLLHPLTCHVNSGHPPLVCDVQDRGDVVCAVLLCPSCGQMQMRIPAAVLQSYQVATEAVQRAGTLIRLVEEGARYPVEFYPVLDAGKIHAALVWCAVLEAGGWSRSDSLCSDERVRVRMSRTRRPGVREKTGCIGPNVETALVGMFEYATRTGAHAESQ